VDQPGVQSVAAAEFGPVAVPVRGIRTGQGEVAALYPVEALVGLVLQRAPPPVGGDHHRQLLRAAALLSRRGWWGGLFYNGAYLSIMLASLVGGFVLPLVGWRWTFAISGLPVLLVIYLRKH